MRFIPLNPIEDNHEALFFLNGGGQIPFTKYNSIVKYFAEFEYNLYAVELPGHGKSSLQTVLNPEEFISEFLTSLDKLIQENNIRLRGMIGFSLGGLLTLKAIESEKFNIPFAIIYGAGFGIGPNERKTYEYYISEQFFSDMNWMPIMKKNHGPGWKTLMLTMQKTMRDSDKIFSDVDLVGNSSTQILILFADNDELFTVGYNFPLIKDKTNIHIRTITNTSHFEYTAKSKEKFLQILLDFERIHRWYS